MQWNHHQHIPGDLGDRRRT